MEEARGRTSTQRSTATSCAFADSAPTSACCSMSPWLRSWLRIWPRMRPSMAIVAGDKKLRAAKPCCAPGGSAAHSSKARTSTRWSDTAPAERAKRAFAAASCRRPSSASGMTHGLLHTHGQTLTIDHARIAASARVIVCSDCALRIVW